MLRIALLYMYTVVLLLGKHAVAKADMGQCPTKSPFWVVFQVLNFFSSFSVNSKELLSNGPNAS